MRVVRGQASRGYAVCTVLRGSRFRPEPSRKSLGAVRTGPAGSNLSHPQGTDAGVEAMGLACPFLAPAP